MFNRRKLCTLIGSATALVSLALIPASAGAASAASIENPTLNRDGSVTVDIVFTCAPGAAQQHVMVEIVQRTRGMANDVTGRIVNTYHCTGGEQRESVTIFADANAGKKRFQEGTAEFAGEFSDLDAQGNTFNTFTISGSQQTLSKT
jgi:hypothetical protein